MFIDAREIGSMISRKQKELNDNDIEKVAELYHNWRGKAYKEQYIDIAGLCKSATIEDVRKNNYILTPGRYIDFVEAIDDGLFFEDKMKHLTSTLKEQMDKASDLDNIIRKNLNSIGYGW